MRDPAAPPPFWSVMIPTYRPKEDHLRKAIESVLSQDPGSEKAQIEVVDDCSPGIDVRAMVKSIAGERIECVKNPQNLGLAGCWNACIARSRGQWVHILHQDDLVLPGFYRRLAEAIALHPEVSLAAARSYHVDEEGIVIGVTGRLRDFENGTRAANAFFYKTPIECPGVVVRKSFYETHGGFLPDLVFTIDCEMWARVVALEGGIVIPDILACHRLFGENETSRLEHSAEDLPDIARLNRIFAMRHPGFDQETGRERVSKLALGRYERFSKAGDWAAARVNWNYWKSANSLGTRLRRFVGALAGRILR